MAHSMLNVVPDSVSKNLPLNNVEMNHIKDCGYLNPNGNTNFAHSSVPVVSLLYIWLLKMEAICLNIFLISSDSKSHPKHDFNAIQVETKNKIVNPEKIYNLRFSRGSIIISTTDITCATAICGISE